MPDMRSTVKLNGTPMTGLLGSGATFNVYRGVCSATLNPITTAADIVGTSVSVVVPTASSIVLAFAYLDMDILNTTTTTSINAFLNWNGTNGNAFSFTNGRSSLHFRATTGFIVQPTITASGTYTAKLQASSTVSSGTNCTIRSSHTTLTVLVISS